MIFPIRQWLDYNPKRSVKKYDDPLVYFTNALDNVYMENKFTNQVFGEQYIYWTTDFWLKWDVCNKYSFKLIY